MIGAIPDKGEVAPVRVFAGEAAHAISALIREIEAETLKDMGRTMAALKQRFAGQMDFGKAGAHVKKLLGGS